MVCGVEEKLSSIKSCKGLAGKLAGSNFPKQKYCILSLKLLKLGITSLTATNANINLNLCSILHFCYQPDMYIPSISSLEKMIALQLTMVTE